MASACYVGGKMNTIIDTESEMRFQVWEVRGTNVYLRAVCQCRSDAQMLVAGREKYYHMVQTKEPTVVQTREPQEIQDIYIANEQRESYEIAQGEREYRRAFLGDE